MTTSRSTKSSSILITELLVSRHISTTSETVELSSLFKSHINTKLYKMKLSTFQLFFNVLKQKKQVSWLGELSYFELPCGQIALCIFTFDTPLSKFLRYGMRRRQGLPIRWKAKIDTIEIGHSALARDLWMPNYTGNWFKFFPNTDLNLSFYFLIHS